MSRSALVVDDDPEVSATVAGLLEILGFQVLQLRDGADVARTAELEAPDLIVMDVMMPVKSGFDAFSELRRNPATGQTPVIFLSAINEFELGNQHDAESIGRALDVPYPEAFLEKPVNLQTLQTVVNRVLGST